MNTPYQMKAKENHKTQADAYREKYKVPHIVIYYDGDEFSMIKIMFLIK